MAGYQNSHFPVERSAANLLTWWKIIIAGRWAAAAADEWRTETGKFETQKKLRNLRVHNCGSNFKCAILFHFTLPGQGNLIFGFYSSYYYDYLFYNFFLLSFIEIWIFLKKKLRILGWRYLSYLREEGRFWLRFRECCILWLEIGS